MLRRLSPPSRSRANVGEEQQTVQYAVASSEKPGGMLENFSFMSSAPRATEPRPLPSTVQCLPLMSPTQVMSRSTSACIWNLRHYSGLRPPALQRSPLPPPVSTRCMPLVDRAGILLLLGRGTPRLEPPFSPTDSSSPAYPR